MLSEWRCWAECGILGLRCSSLLASWSPGEAGENSCSLPPDPQPPSLGLLLPGAEAFSVGCQGGERWEASESGLVLHLGLSGAFVSSCSALGSWRWAALPTVLSPGTEASVCHSRLAQPPLPSFIFRHGQLCTDSLSH